VRSTDDAESGWSEPTTVEAALLDPSDWAATWIGAPRTDGRVPRFRSVWDVPSPVRRARLYITACGVYVAELNGAPCSDHVLPPGWTSYHHRLRYQVLDVTDLLQRGDNTLDVTVGAGWYSGRLGFEGRGSHYGEGVALLAQLEVEHTDGTTSRIVTGDDWQVAPSEITSADLYDGQTTDARLEPGPEDWVAVVTFQPKVGRLEAAVGEPVRRLEELTPIEVITSPSGRTILDFGQNLVGRVRFTVDAGSGTEVTLRHAEVLEHGELCTRTLRTADATDRYTSAGDGPATWEPQLTFHGFRYVEVTGWPGDVDPDAFRALVCHSDMTRTGWFSCSHAGVTKLHDNVVWGMRGNFLDVPTDCPQRDERLGWTGDLQVFAPTAHFLFDIEGFVDSWLADLTADQADDGTVPLVVPSILDANPAAAGWGDAAVTVPWSSYLHRGDVDLLARQLPSMRRWVDRAIALAGPDRLWQEGFQFGDWLDPSAPGDRPAHGRTDPHLVATAYLARSTALLADACDVLGEVMAASHYGAVSAEVREAFNREYVTATGRLVSDSQTAHAMAICFDLLSEDHRGRAGDRLRSLVADGGFRIEAGFLGTPLVCDALTLAGHTDVAYSLLLQTEAPSWLYAVTMGATTIWERWDALLPDGTVNGDSMTSFNHYAFGAVADWLHRVVAGIEPVEPGYRRSRIAPRPGGRVTWAEGVLDTPYGRLSSRWELHGLEIRLDVEVPPSTAAQVDVPGGGGIHHVGPGRHSWVHTCPADEVARWVPTPTLDDPIGDLRADPVAWGVLVRHLPDVEMIPAGSDLDRMSLPGLLEKVGVDVPAETMAEVRRALAAITG
jgi:alpha-L-rhamnosidase